MNKYYEYENDFFLFVGRIECFKLDECGYK